MAAVENDHIAPSAVWIILSPIVVLKCSQWPLKSQSKMAIRSGVCDQSLVSCEDSYLVGLDAQSPHVVRCLRRHSWHSPQMDSPSDRFADNKRCDPEPSHPIIIFSVGVVGHRGSTHTAPAGVTVSCAWPLRSFSWHRVGLRYTHSADQVLQLWARSSLCFL